MSRVEAGANRPGCSGARLKVLERREYENTEYLLAEVGSEVSKITSDEVRGSRRDSSTEYWPILVAELHVAAEVWVEDAGGDNLDRLQEPVQSLPLIGIGQIPRGLLDLPRHTPGSGCPVDLPDPVGFASSWKAW